MNPRVVALGLLVLLGLVTPASVAAAPTNVEPYELDNGLRVLLRPVQGAQEVAIVVLFDIGEDLDPVGQSGLAHCVEHCYVTCAAGDIPARTAEQMMARYPQRWNAQTGARYTVIAFVAPQANLDAELADAAARMGALEITQADLDREKPRMLLELRNMYGGFPPLAAANLAHGRAHPPATGARKGGVTEHVTALPLDAVQESFCRFYKPRHARLVLAGGFDAAEAKAMIERHFGALPPGETHRVPRPRAAATLAPLQVVRVPALGPNVTGHVTIAVRAPAPNSARYAPFLVAASRLSLAWQRGGLDGLSAMTMFTVLDNPDVLSVGMALPAEADAEQAARRLGEAVRTVLARPLAIDEQKQARRQYGWLLDTMPIPDAMLANNVYGVAFGLGRRDQLGLDPARLIEALDGVDEASFRAMVEEVFAPARLAAVAVVPE